MRRIVLFCEDSLHESFVGSMVKRLAEEEGVSVELQPRSAAGGFPRMLGELRLFLRDVAREHESAPDAVLVVLDANCHGYQDRRRDVLDLVDKHPRLSGLVECAIPDPHIERWMLVDSKAFRKIFGRGCTLPAAKCDKSEYKTLLRNEIHKSGVHPPLGGREYAIEIVQEMDLGRAAQREHSLGLFLRALRAFFARWKEP